MSARVCVPDGLLVLDKPKGPTSAGCLDRIKRVVGKVKIGHGGTLDPMATGLLLVLFGQATKIADYVAGGEKVYSGEAILGVTTDSYDVEGAVVEERSADHIDKAAVGAAVAEWTVLASQVAPPVSAVKHQGKPLYRLAREGKEIPVKIRPITIHRAEVLSYDLPRFRFRVECSAGVYIRSLVHSLGSRLGVGAALSSLTREASRPFTLDEATPLETVLAAPERIGDFVRPIEAALSHWPQLELAEFEIPAVHQGQMIVHDERRFGQAVPGGRALLLGPGRRPLALASLGIEGPKPAWKILRGLWSVQT